MTPEAAAELPRPRPCCAACAPHPKSPRQACLFPRCPCHPDAPPYHGPDCDCDGPGCPGRPFG